MKHYKLRSDKIYIISNVEHTFTLFTRTKQILHLITDNLLFCIVLLRPDAPVSRKLIKGVLGMRSYVRMLCVKVSRTRFPSSRAIIEVYLEINLFYIMYLCHSPIYFTLSRRGSSPPLVQMEEMILNFPYLYIKMWLFSSSLLYQLKQLINHEECGFHCHEGTAKEILLCLERSIEADVPRKGRFPLREEKRKINWR